MLEAISKRQSIRQYTDEEVTKEEITELLKAAMRAPTARNMQSWRFIVISKRENLNEIKTFAPSYRMMDTANKAIIVLGDKDVQRYEFIFEDCAAAIENMCLEACNLNLGTCYCAIAPKEEAMEAFQKKFQYKDNLIPVAIVAVGHPDENPPYQNRYDETKITWF